MDQLCVIWCICYLFNVKIIYFSLSQFFRWKNMESNNRTLWGKCLVCTNSLVKAAAIIISLWYQDSFPPPKWVWTPDHIPLIFYPWQWAHDLAYCWYSRHACRIIGWSQALKSPENLSLIVNRSFWRIKMWASASRAIIATSGHDWGWSHARSKVSSSDRKLLTGLSEGKILNVLALISTSQSCSVLKPMATGNAVPVRK